MDRKKCAFAVYASGDRYVGYRNYVVRRLHQHVPGVDIVDLDMEEARSLLTGAPEGQMVYFSRLAIPLMRQFDKYDRVVWLDVDVDIFRGFAEILNVDTGKDGLAAASDVKQNKYKSYLKTRFGGYNGSVYCNAGVLVMDLCKIDKAEWRRKIDAGLDIHRRVGLKLRDQDLLNGMFSITEMDPAFGWVWRKGEAPGRTFCIHYVDKGGHREMDRIVSGSNDGGDMDMLDRCIVVSPRHELIRPWIRAYFASGNKIPLVIVPGPPGDWRDDDMEYCEAAAEYSGGTVFDCSDEWALSRPLASRAVSRNVGWYSKKALLHAIATRLSPKEWAWIDDDAEIVGNLDECFDYAASSPGFICTQFYAPNETGKYDPSFDYVANGGPKEKGFVRRPLNHVENPDNRHPDRDYNNRMCWNCMMFFHNDANERLKSLDSEFPIEDDECIFGHLYHNDEKWHEGFCDFSAKGWQTSFTRLADMPSSWNGKILHYTGNAHGREVKRYWAAKADKLPPAPFEAGLAMNAVDAVFVIGTGSADNNTELRYALRSVEKNCPFVRNVYICGFCPPWVDRSKVIHLQWPDRFSHAKDANIIDKLRHACEQRGIAKRILFCSDDQFQTRQCTWDDFTPRWIRMFDPSDGFYADMGRVWHSRLRDTLVRETDRRRSEGVTDAARYFQPHMWMQIDRDTFLDYARWSGYESRCDTIIASGYFNFAGVVGVQDYDHVFLSPYDREIPSATHVGYNDGSYRNALSILKRLFPDPSRFETLDVVPRDPMLAIPSIGRYAKGTGANASRIAASMYGKAHEPKPDFRPDPLRRADARTSCGLPGDPSPASPSESMEILRVAGMVRDTPVWHGLLGEISRAEELRLFGVPGWRTVWRDIIGRWSSATANGRNKNPVESKRSPDAASVISAYLSDQAGMRTVRFSNVGAGSVGQVNIGAERLATIRSGSPLAQACERRGSVNTGAMRARVIETLRGRL